MMRVLVELYEYRLHVKDPVRCGCRFNDVRFPLSGAQTAHVISQDI